MEPSRRQRNLLFQAGEKPLPLGQHTADHLASMRRKGAQRQPTALPPLAVQQRQGFFQTDRLLLRPLFLQQNQIQKQAAKPPGPTAAQLDRKSVV